jgi:alkanesulfonate monooxygenase SsuD/methylene tetrahydromethanopterin reductase-like flavin-dependent oxidoreductase (luciferase family)
MPSPNFPIPAGSIGVILPPMAPGALGVHSLRTNGTTKLPTFGSTEQIVADCQAAEAAGASAIWATDHLFWRQPTLECLTACVVAATATSHAVLGTCVLQLPLRSPAVVAKQVAALQVLSGGRFVLGVGVGSHPGEYGRAGVDYATRGRRLDKGIAALRAAWTHAGEDYRLAPALPAPVWVGGASPAAIERAATLGDGWVPLFLDPPTFASRLAQVRDLRSAAGGDPAELAAAVVMVAHVDADEQRARERGTGWLAALYGIAPKAFARHLVAGPATLVADAVHRYLSSGATHVVVLVAADHPMEHFTALMEAAAPASRKTRAAVPHFATSGASV